MYVWGSTARTVRCTQPPLDPTTAPERTTHSPARTLQHNESKTAGRQITQQSASLTHYARNACIHNCRPSTHTPIQFTQPLRPNIPHNTIPTPPTPRTHNPKPSHTNPIQDPLHTLPERTAQHHNHKLQHNKLTNPNPHQRTVHRKRPPYRRTMVSVQLQSNPILIKAIRRRHI